MINSLTTVVELVEIVELVNGNDEFVYGVDFIEVMQVPRATFLDGIVLLLL